MGLRKLPSSVVRPAFRVVPMSGYHMTRFGPGELLVVNDEDTTNNVILDDETIAGVLFDRATGGPMDEFERGLGTMWTIERSWD